MEDLILSQESHMGNFGITTTDLRQLVQPTEAHLIGRRARPVPQELLDQAIANNPLKDMPHWFLPDESNTASLLKAVLPGLKKNFFENYLSGLITLGITFDTPLEDANRLIDQEIAKSNTGALKAYYKKNYTDLRELFPVFQNLFVFIETIIEKGIFEEKHLTAFYSIYDTCRKLNSPTLRVKLFKPIGLQIAFNQQHGIYELPTVLPINNLSEVLLAMPVWYFGNITSSVTIPDPEISWEVRHICNAVNSKNFAWLYQMYNRRNRSIMDIPFLDPIPIDYAKFRDQLTGLVDLEIITTPYHSVSSREWANPAWLAGIDPLAIAMHKDIPFFTIMKRWSGTGIFPLIDNLIANTIDHIRQNKEKLENFPKNSYWHSSGSGPLKLIPFADELLKSFEEGKVFEFLRK